MAVATRRWLPRALAAGGLALLAGASVAADPAEIARGKLLFTTLQPACAVCHTLQAAGAEGQIGPVLDELKPGMVQVHGVAFGGTRGIKGVEVSVDGGKTWQAAQLIGPDLGRFAWRQFVLPVRLGAGTHVLASRATDTAGNVQPEQREENVGGYNNASWADHAVTVSVA